MERTFFIEHGESYSLLFLHTDSLVYKKQLTPTPDDRKEVEKREHEEAMERYVLLMSQAYAVRTAIQCFIKLASYSDYFG